MTQSMSLNKILLVSKNSDLSNDKSINQHTLEELQFINKNEFAKLQ